MTTGKVTALIRQTLVCKIMSLLFNMLSRLVIASYPSTLDGRQTENQNHRKITNLITWTTALSNSMKLWAMPCRATKDRWVMVESTDKTWSSGEGNGKPLQYFCLENPMNSMKRQKDRTLENELPRSVYYWKLYILPDPQPHITPEKMKRRSQSKNNTQLWMLSGDGNKVQSCKEQYCIGT